MGIHQHIAVIPGRAGSKGLPGKNRYLFGLTADFIRAAKFFDRVIVTSDDPLLLEMAKAEGFEVHCRPAELASDDASIKQTFEDLVENVDVDPMDYLWLLFIPLVYKDVDDFCLAKAILEKNEPASLCSFIPAQSHPYYCWRIDKGSGQIERYIDHDLYRRQDLPDAWEEYPYLCAIRADAIKDANSNLIRKDTCPVMLNQQQSERMVDVDEINDFSKWERSHPDHFQSWRDQLPDDVEFPKGLKKQN